MDRLAAIKARAKTWSGLAITDNREIDSGLYQWLGATLRNLTNFGRESAVVGGMELADNRGVLVKTVPPGSIASRLRIPAGAVIVAANGRPVSNIEDLSATLRASAPVRLKILTVRGYVEIQVDAGQELPKPQ